MFETLGHYKILELIGAGGIGEVCRARDTRHGRTVAIKVVGDDIRDDPERRERFLHDARAAAALSHPNIAALYEVGEDQGELFLAIEFVPGDTLQEVIGGRPLNPRRAVDFAMQIADALAEAHADGMVDGDIKPANIIITPKDKAKILDFGLAAWTAGGAAREQVARSAAPGASRAAAMPASAAYMSPEQALGQAVEPRTDLFSLGVVLFEMLTGRLPFAAAPASAQVPPGAHVAAPLVSASNRSIPKELDAIVAKALARQAEQRYESAATFAADLRSVGAVLDMRSDAAAPAVAPTTVPRQRSLGKWIGVVLLVAAAGALAWYARTAIERIVRTTVGAPPPPLIAVAPLELATQDPSKSYFADGFTEDLISRLGQTPGLKVLGRSATRANRGRPAAEVGRDLGAAVVLTGSVAPSADSIRASLTLVDTRDGAVVWTSQYGKELKNVFALQAQMAGDIASALHVTLRPTRAREVALARAIDPQAYDLYLRGKDAAAARSHADAVKLYEQAIAADAGIGEAFAGIAIAVQRQIDRAEAADDPPHRDRLLAAAKRSYEIDPDLPQANVAMGVASASLADALKFLRRAIELDPSDGEAPYLVGKELDDFDPELALAFFEKSIAVDPRLDANRTAVAAVLWRLGRDDEARAAVSALKSDAMASARVSRMAALADLHQERYGAAVQQLVALPDLRSTPHTGPRSSRRCAANRARTRR